MLNGLLELLYVGIDDCREQFFGNRNLEKQRFLNIAKKIRKKMMILGIFQVVFSSERKDFDTFLQVKCNTEMVWLSQDANITLGTWKILNNMCLFAKSSNS